MTRFRPKRTVTRRDVRHRCDAQLQACTQIRHHHDQTSILVTELALEKQVFDRDKVNKI